MRQNSARIGLIIKQPKNIGLIVVTLFLMVASFMLLTSKNTKMAAAAPFECSPAYYQSVGDSNTELMEIDIANDRSDVIRTSTYTYNALGYDTADNYMYAIQQGDTQQLLRIHADQPIETVRSLPASMGDKSTMWRAGDMDDSRNLWAYRWSGDHSSQFARVSVVNDETELITFRNPNNIQMQNVADFVYKDGKLYGIGGPQNAGKGGNILYTVDVGKRTIESAVPLSGLPPANYGAGWVTSDDHLYFLKNEDPGGGTIYEIVGFKEGSAAAIYFYQVATAGGKAAANDGASCRDAATLLGYVPSRDGDFTGNPSDPGDITKDSVLGDATHNGNPGVNEGDVTLRIKKDSEGNPMDGGLTGVGINSDGKFSVPDGAIPGDYDVVYEMCDSVHPIPCNEGTVTIRVAGYIKAADDNFSAAPFLSHEGGTTGSVLTNDNQVDADADVNPISALSDSTTVQTPTIQGMAGQDPNADVLNFVSFTNDGKLAVEPGAPAGTHQISYQVCENFYPADPAANPCDTAIMTIVIQAWADIQASDDTFTFGQDGATNLNVFANDTVDGNAASGSNTTGVSIVDNDGLSGVTINNEGVVTVPADSLPGTYDVVYELCEAAFPANCEQATATITVEADALVIDETKDFTDAPLPNDEGGTTTGSILDNGTLGGDPISPDDVEITVTNPGDVPQDVVINDDGTVTVPPNTTPGDYTIEYEVCETKHLPAYQNCDTGSVTITVAETPITAENDTVSVNGNTGGTSTSVLANDEFDGATATTNDVTVTPTGQLPAGVTLNADGTVTVAENTPEGTHTIPYQICETARPTNCDSAEITLTITSGPAEIIVNDEALDPVVDGPAGNVLANDTHNGQPAENTGTSRVTVDVTDDGGLTGVTIDENGNLIVPPNTPAGEYDVEYRVCETAFPDNCETGMATVTVAAKPIVAQNDSYTHDNGRTGGIVSVGGTPATVAANDTLDGGAVTLGQNTGDATLSTVRIDDALIFNEATGEITVAPGTPEGTYSLEYRVCENLNPANCETAIATVVVDAAPIDAGDGTVAQNPVSEGPAGNVYDDVTLDGDPINPNEVTADITDDGGLTGVTINENGDVIVPQDTPAGDYTISYEICENLNPTNCDDATITITVLAPTITASDDQLPAISTKTGGSAGTLFANDTINGNPVTEGRVTLTPLGTLPNGITLNETTGEVQVAQGTAPGVYEFEYQICHIANPTVCETALAQIEVTRDDMLETAPEEHKTIGSNGGPVVDVSGNTTINGEPVTNEEITIRIVDNGGIDGVTINDDGTIMIPAGVTPGEYTITYEVCLVSDSSVCVQQSVTFTVVGHHVEYPGAPNSGFAQRVLPVAGILSAVAVVIGATVVGVRYARMRP